jgi:hypothetical protein
MPKNQQRPASSAKSRSPDHSDYSPPAEIRFSTAASPPPRLRKRDRIKSFLRSKRGPKAADSIEAKREALRTRILRRVVATRPKSPPLHPVLRQDKLAAYREMLRETSNAASMAVPGTGKNSVEEWLANTAGTSQASGMSADTMSTIGNETPTRKANHPAARSQLASTPLEEQEPIDHRSDIDAKIEAVYRRLQEQHPDLFGPTQEVAPSAVSDHYSDADELSRQYQHPDGDVFDASPGSIAELCCVFCGEAAFSGTDYAICGDCLEDVVKDACRSLPDRLESALA